MTFSHGDVVLVPFPFTDIPITRVRPALVISNAGEYGATGQVVCAMITSAARSNWPLDVPILDHRSVGLSHSSVVRMKLFTLPIAFVLERLGRLDHAMTDMVETSIRKLLLTKGVGS